MKILQWALISLTLIALTTPARAAPHAVTVLELFTTQGCANCPPADDILDKITTEAQDGVIALGCHVTFFDRAPWKDTFSLPVCDERQKA
jgi:hypothetical protein